MNYIRIIIILTGSIVLSSSSFSNIARHDESLLAAQTVSIASVDGIALYDNQDIIVAPTFTFASVNGITLYDNQETIVLIFGNPDFVELDTHFKDLETYHYPTMNICFDSGVINYVEVLPEAETIKIDDTIIPIHLDDLEKALGKPDFVAEDGIVFQRNNAVIKIFLDDTEEVIAIDYYHISSI